MKSNNGTSIIVICGIFILAVFTYVITINLLPDNTKSEVYYAKTNENMNSRIESLIIEKGLLTIKTSGEPSFYCAKTTKSNPTEKSLCWKKMESNVATVTVYEGKQYYVWIKDSNNKISNPKTTMNN